MFRPKAACPIPFRGRVFSGKGDGAGFLQLPWVNQQILRKLNFKPYPGTLNVQLFKLYIKNKMLLREFPAIEILPREGYFLGKCFKVTFMNVLTCALIIPEVPHYPKDVIEVIAPVNLREKFKLKDGTVVEAKTIPL